jgi:predicted phosphoribosyltransferase
MSLFRNRCHAGSVLSQKLKGYDNRNDVLVLGLPRGGVPVAHEVAMALRAPLDVFIVRKLGVPGHEEYAMGAIASGGVQVLNEALVKELMLGTTEIDAVVQREQLELARRERLYRGERPLPDLRGRTALVVDDGMATGATMRAAVKALRALKAGRIVVAVPVGAADTCAALRKEADKVVCAATPEPFRAVGAWYEDFSQTCDDEVRELLAASRREATAAR